MALSYEVDSKLKALAPIVDEHAEWYTRVLRTVFYPDRPSDHFSPPQSFAAWITEVEGDDFVASATLEKLKKMQAELYDLAAQLIRSRKSQAVARNLKPMMVL